MYIVSCCSMCRRANETVGHLFLECCFAQQVCRWILYKFGEHLSFQGDFIDFIKGALVLNTSPQVRCLWYAAIAPLFWGIWMQRNACEFRDKPISFNRLTAAIFSWVKEAGTVSKCLMLLCLTLCMISW